MKYNIYAGLGGGFGGSEYILTEEFNTKNEALKYARDEAIEIYKSYEGFHGIRSYNEIVEEYEEEYGETLSEVDANLLYWEEAGSTTQREKGMGLWGRTESDTIAATEAAAAEGPDGEEELQKC